VGSSYAFDVIVTCGVACMGVACSTSPASSAFVTEGDSAGQADLAMLGTLYEPGRSFGQTYCSPCHWKGGQHPRQPAAYPAFQVDTYEQWASVPQIVPTVLDKWHPDGVVMPPPEALVFPADDERMLILDWARRGSPNAPNGL
jgi:hypothetical protein